MPVVHHGHRAARLYISNHCQREATEKGVTAESVHPRDRQIETSIGHMLWSDDTPGEPVEEDGKDCRRIFDIGESYDGRRKTGKVTQGYLPNNPCHHDRRQELNPKRP